MNFDVEKNRLLRLGAALCWTWVAAHLVNQAIVALHMERELRSEARVLLDRVCDLPRSFSAGSVLIPCDEARAVMARGPLLLVAAEHAAGALMADVLGAARREFGAIVRAAGFAGALMSAAVLALHAAAARSKIYTMAREEQTRTSQFYRLKGASILSLEDGDGKALRCYDD